MRSILLSMLVACAYHGGSFTSWGDEFAGQRTTVGCLDLAVERRADHSTGPVLAYNFGNRCDRAVTVDLKHVTVIAKTSDGDVMLVPFDPQHEIRPLPLDGRSAGAEAIEYRMGDRGEVRTMCVDVSGVVDARTSDWQCFESPSQIVETM